MDTKLGKMERKNPVVNRWTQDSVAYVRYLREARTATAAELLTKMHQEAVDRGQLLMLKIRARKLLNLFATPKPCS